jgi:hypothetical protein
MTRPEAGRQGLRDAQFALAARATLLASVLVSVLVSVLMPALVAGHWGTVGGTALSMSVFGSAAVSVGVWALLAPVVLQALALQGAVRGSVPRERVSASLTIRRPEEPGRPGRPRPRAPGAGTSPQPAR